MENFDKLKILNEFISLVKNGSSFSKETLIMAGQKFDIKSSILSILFENNLADIVYLYIENGVQTIDKSKLDKTNSFTERISNSSVILLRYFNEKPIFFRLLIKFLVKNPIFGAKILYKFSSKIMKICNENSLDFSHYSKRITLLGIYFSIAIDILRGKNIEILEAKLLDRIRLFGDLGRKFKKRS